MAIPSAGAYPCRQRNERDMPTAAAQCRPGQSQFSRGVNRYNRDQKYVIRKGRLAALAFAADRFAPNTGPRTQSRIAFRWSYNAL